MILTFTYIISILLIIPFDSTILIGIISIVTTLLITSIGFIIGVWRKHERDLSNLKSDYRTLNTSILFFKEEFEKDIEELKQDRKEQVKTNAQIIDMLSNIQNQMGIMHEQIKNLQATKEDK